MFIRYLSAGLTAMLVAALAQGSHAATTWSVNCHSGTINPGSISSSTPLGTLLGTQNGPSTLATVPVSGDMIEITGICTEDVEVRTPGLTITNDSNSASLDTSDGVQGQFEFNGAQRTTLNGILVGATSLFSFTNSGDVANLYAHDGSALKIQNAQISFGPLLGVEVQRSSQITLLSTTVENNGGGPSAGTNSNAGIQGMDGSTVVLGKSDGTETVTVSGNAGPGAAAIRNGSLVINSAMIQGNGNTGNGFPTIYAFSSSSVFISGEGALATQISNPGGGADTINAIGSSTVLIENDALVSGNASNAAIELDAASTLGLQGTLVESAGTGAGDDRGQRQQQRHLAGRQPHLRRHDPHPVPAVLHHVVRQPLRRPGRPPIDAASGEWQLLRISLPPGQYLRRRHDPPAEHRRSRPGQSSRIRARA